MPRGHAAKREPKKPKKDARKQTSPPPVFTSQEVEVIKRPRKREEEE